jgi:hypothetical protein
MYVAITLGALLVGGWALDAPVEEQAAATSAAPAPNVGAPIYSAPLNLPDRNRLQTGVSPDTVDRLRNRTGQGGQTPGNQQSRGQSQGTAGQLPYLPTERLPLEAEGTQGQPMAPTANIPLPGTGGAGGLSTATGPIYGPLSPTSNGRGLNGPWTPGYHPSSSAIDQQNSRAQSLGGRSVLAPTGSPKAFSGYQPTSGVSPYMNLFRRDGGTVDNYTSLVRPQLDQRNLNQQFNRDINGLNRSAIMQGAMLQQLNSAARTPQGVSTPQFNMNSGGYFPQ